MGFLAILLFGLGGCGLSTSNPALLTGSATPGNSVAVHGHVGSTDSSISGSKIQLYAAGTQGTATTATALLASPLQTDSSGNFTISEGYTCPSPGSQLYLLATGGNPGSTSSTNNDAIALITLLGPCSGLSATVTYPIDEVTTVGSVWPLAKYIASATQLGASPSDSAFNTALGKVSQLVNLATASSPGTGIPAGYAVQTPKLYTLADDLHACVASSGGVAGDSSACGQLLSLATVPGYAAPKSTLEAALNLAQDNQLSVNGLFQLLPANAPFLPMLPTLPSDWNLNLVAVPAPPTLNPASGAYAAGQAITINSTSGAVIHYTTDGSTPLPTSLTYSAPLSLNSAETVNAIAVTEDIGSAVSSADFTLTSAAPVNTPVSVAITPLTATLSTSQSQPFVAAVTGAPSSSVTWSINPAIGSISSTGVYTAPSAINGLQTVTITATAGNAATMKTATATVALTPAGTGNLIYYVDNVAGNDTNNGTSAASPLATVARVNALNLQPGQTVAFKAGDVWHEMLTVTHSGSAGNPIIYTSYGSGAQPVIDASDTVSGWAHAAGLPGYVWSLSQSSNPQLPNFAGQAGIPVANSGAINASNQFYWNGNTLYVYSTTDPTTVVEVAARTSALTSPGASYVTVSNIELRGGTNVVACGPAIPCTFWDLDSNTINSGGEVGLSWAMNLSVNGGNLTINNNTFRGMGSSGIGVANGGSSLGDLITNNTMDDLCKIYVQGSSENAFCDAINLFSQTGTDGGGQILGNAISNVGLHSGGPYGGGIHPDTVINWDIEHNIISNTNYPGIELEKGSGSVARYNLLTNTGQYPYFGGLFIRAGEGLNVTNMLAEYNTVVGGYWACTLGITQNSGAVTATNISMNRNICTGAASGTQLWLDPGFLGSGNSFSTNGFGVAANGFVSAGSVLYGAYALLPAGVVNSIAGDPQFVNPGSGNYMLQATSPDHAIGAFPQP